MNTQATFHVEGGHLVIRKDGEVIAVFHSGYFPNMIMALVKALKERSDGSQH